MNTSQQRRVRFKSLFCSYYSRLALSSHLASSGLATCQ